jgi:hypothetical protein
MKILRKLFKSQVKSAIGAWKYDSSSDQYSCNYKGFEFSIDPKCTDSDSNLAKIDNQLRQIIRDYSKLEKRVIEDVVNAKETKEYFSNPAGFVVAGDFVSKINDIKKYKLDKDFTIRIDYSIFVRLLYDGDYMSKFASIDVDLDSDLKLQNFQFGD